MTQQQLSTTNPYITRIQAQIRELPGRSPRQPGPLVVDWLVLSHDDSFLLRQLEEAFPKGVLAAVTIPQSRWRMGEELVAELVGWAIRDLGVKGVMLVGHSQGGVPAEQVKLLGANLDSQAGGLSRAGLFSGSPMNRLRKAQARAEAVQAHFEEQMERLCRIPAMENGLERGRVQLHGLFYRAESGLFCAYDPQQRVFIPLFDEQVAA